MYTHVFFPVKLNIIYLSLSIFVIIPIFYRDRYIDVLIFHIDYVSALNMQNCTIILYILFLQMHII